MVGSRRNPHHYCIRGVAERTKGGTVSRRAAASVVLILIAAGCVMERSEPIASAAPHGPTATAEARASSSQPTTAAPLETPTATDEGVVQALAAFARAPGAGAFAAVRFADKVRLGLSDRLITERASAELLLRDAWVLREEPFRGHVAPFSALDLLARNVPTTISIGPHPHCASPPVPPPTDLVRLRRVSVQPTGIDTCLLWWTVDLFISPTGRVEAVTLDLWDP
jgi:hypothetical protein